MVRLLASSMVFWTPTSMMRLHALKRMDEHSPTREIKGLFLGLDGSLHGTTRPEGMAHGAPRVLGVSAKSSCAILTNNETGRSPGEGQIHQAVLVHG